MNEIEQTPLSSQHEHIPPQRTNGSISYHDLFAQLSPHDVEQFYQGYHLWTLHQQSTAMTKQLTTLYEKIIENEVQMQRITPSALALASLAQLQACGVTDIDLLDTMLERGEGWLDHAMQLLERCERLDLIGGNYTEWCQHALNGAYDWIGSMSEKDEKETEETAVVAEYPSESVPMPELSQATEELLLQKLMSENDDGISAEQIQNVQDAETDIETIEYASKPEEIVIETTEHTADVSPQQTSRITQPLAPLEDTASVDETGIIEEVTIEEIISTDEMLVPEEINTGQPELESDFTLPLAAYTSVPTLKEEDQEPPQTGPVEETKSEVVEPPTPQITEIAEEEESKALILETKSEEVHTEISNVTETEPDKLDKPAEELTLDVSVDNAVPETTEQNDVAAQNDIIEEPTEEVEPLILLSEEESTEQDTEIEVEARENNEFTGEEELSETGVPDQTEEETVLQEESTQPDTVEEEVTQSSESEGITRVPEEEDSIEIEVTQEVTNTILSDEKEIEQNDILGSVDESESEQNAPTIQMPKLPSKYSKVSDEAEAQPPFIPPLATNVPPVTLKAENQPTLILPVQAQSEHKQESTTEQQTKKILMIGKNFDSTNILDQRQIDRGKQGNEQHTNSSEQPEMLVREENGPGETKEETQTVEKKPQALEPTRKRGFFRWLLAIFWRR